MTKNRYCIMNLNEAKQILNKNGYLLESVNFSPVFDAIYNMPDTEFIELIRIMKKINETFDEEKALKYKDRLIELLKINYL